MTIKKYSGKFSFAGKILPTMIFILRKQHEAFSFYTSCPVV
jgi:hypothetical protein